MPPLKFPCPNLTFFGPFACNYASPRSVVVPLAPPFFPCLFFFLLCIVLPYFLSMKLYSLVVMYGQLELASCTTWKQRLLVGSSSSCCRKHSTKRVPAFLWQAAVCVAASGVREKCKALSCTALSWQHFEVVGGAGLFVLVLILCH